MESKLPSALTHSLARSTTPSPALLALSFHSGGQALPSNSSLPTRFAPSSLKREGDRPRPARRSSGPLPSVRFVVANPSLSSPYAVLSSSLVVAFKLQSHSATPGMPRAITQHMYGNARKVIPVALAISPSNVPCRCCVCPPPTE